jgi:hypothetical protein
MNVKAALAKGKKVRMKSWWWGRYVHRVAAKFRFEDGMPCNPNNIPTTSDEWEVYNEEKHGKHNRDPIDAKYEDKFLKDMK